MALEIYFAIGFVMLLQVTFWILLLFFFLKVSRKSNGQSDQPVSVIICAYNDAHALQRHLPSFFHQIGPKYEVCVVNDHSTDNTSDLLCKMASEYPNLRVQTMTSKSGLGKKAALRCGIESAMYENLVLSDADSRPTTDVWLSKMSGHLNAAVQIVAGYSPFVEQPTSVNAFARYENMMTALQMFGFACAGMPYMVVGRNVAYRKELFGKINFFDQHQHVAGGDDDLTVQQALQHTHMALTLDPDTFVYTDAASDWKTYFKQKTRHLGVAVYYTMMSRSVLTIFNGTWLFYYILIGILLALGFVKMACIALLLKWTVSVVVFYYLNRILKQSLSILQVIVGDVVYPFLMAIIAFNSLIKKRTTWN